MGKAINILMLEDDKDEAGLIQKMLTKLDENYELSLARNREDYINLLQIKSADVVLSDYNLPDINGDESLSLLRARSKDIPFILVSGTIGEEKAVELMRNGANDFIMKDKLARLVPAIQREIREFRTRQQLRKEQDDLIQALRESETRYKKAQALGHVGNWEYDIETSKFWGSDEAKRIYGFSPDSENFTTDEVEQCIPDRIRVHQALIDLIEEDKEYDLQFEIITNDTGETRTIQSVAALEKDHDGNPVKVTGVIKEITEQVEAELELNNYKDSLELLVKERTKELEEKNKKLENFNKLFIDREFRIKELKDRVKELETNLIKD